MKIKEIFIIGCGLGDMSLENNPDFIFLDKYPIYLLLDRFVGKRKTEDFIYWLKYQSYFLKEYPMDLVGRAHMVVIDLPEKYYLSYDKFSEGKYSEMFSKDQINRLFSIESKEYKVLMKDRTILPQFAMQLINLFELKDLNPSEIQESELELPYTLTMEEEFFNYELPH